jgi:hypothetical protein
MGRQLHVRLLAPGHGHPHGRPRWQRCHRSGSNLEFIHRDAAIPGLRLRPQHDQRRGGNRVGGVYDGTDNTSFATGSDFLPGVLRNFDSFSAAAGEAADSQIFGGTHLRCATEDGLRAGISIGGWTMTHELMSATNGKKP